jgi:proteic killer suppression protein
MDTYPKYRDRDTENFANNLRARKLESVPTERGLAKLEQIYAATVLFDLRNPPGNRFESLKGNRQGQYSIRINDQWRICFEWSEDARTAFNIEIVDYH